ncbi:armadillo-type protein [Flammula alnicola]|nr:armadillo-type protein [Flammula alnicola]
MSTVRPPSHIPLPPPPAWLDIATQTTDPPSPFAIFYTPPTSPTIFYTPPTSPFHDPKPPALPPVPTPETPLVPVLQPSSPTDDHFPPPVDVPIDLAIDDEGLSTLEKIYLYSRSGAAFHRVFITHALPDYLFHVTPQEAVEYVLPLLGGLAMDDDELVKEALAAELVPVVWWFFTHCQIIPDDLRPEEAYASSSTTVTISVQAFTPILGTLLLSSNPLVGGAARFAVVDLLSRMKKADDRQLGAFLPHHQRHSPGEIIHPWDITRANHDDDDDDEAPLVIGLFGHQERSMFTQEILQQVVIGMGRLDVDYEPEQQVHVVPQEQPLQATELDSTNPYFPPLSSSYPSQPRANHASWYSAAAGPEMTSAPPHAVHAPGAGTFSSPGTDFPPDIVRELAPSARSPVALHERHGSSSVETQVGRLSPPLTTTSAGSPMDTEFDWDELGYDGEEGEDEQAAVGRLSSMSLMAAVTASGTLEGDTQRAFVKEVERVGRDPVYWVRREASFALGALAKVVPEEIVVSSLLPLFDALRWDAVWHVRHSALFALPAILSRLSPAQRKTVALETIFALSSDPHPTVRSGVLEALGEVIYTFHEDSEGPPKELINLFLGRKEDRRVRDGQQAARPEGLSQTTQELFFDDPKRHLICAFNFPAVALTLGGRRWGELREAYFEITSDTSAGVRRTLAASLGELAKIIGPENAKEDLVDVWWSNIKSEEEDVRTKAIESTRDFVEVVGKEVGIVLVQGLLTAWNEGTFRGWRERELVIKNLVSWVTLIGLDTSSLARGVLMKGLEDSVAAVRETTIGIVPHLLKFLLSQKDLVDDLHRDLVKLATSSNYRRRMTFIACQQTLALATDNNGQLVISCDDDFLRSVADLANDGIDGVRIGVARFAALVHGNFLHHSRSIPSILHDLVQRLSQDSSHEVQSYVADLSLGEPSGGSGVSLASSRRYRKRLVELATFSRPPPAPSNPSSPSVGVFLKQAPASSFGVNPELERTFSGS